MDSSPKGREIEPVVGNAGAIVKRGNNITVLGDQMISSAAMLKRIADGASGQEGLAVDKLQEVVGDTHSELELAGKRYQPTGPVLVKYGNVLAEVQPLIKTAVENCEADWKAFQAKQSDVFDASMSYYVAPPVADGAEPVDAADLRKDAVDDAQGLATSAHDDWKAEAKIFDRHYDTWEDAFDAAAKDIGTETKGGISDTRWDDLDGFVAGALEVLKWVGLALAVLCVIVGGPFLAAIAAIAAIATLALTLYSFARGNSSVLDLVLAVVGVIPFGSLGKLFSGNKLGFLDDMAGGLTSTVGRTAIKGDVSGMIGGLRAGLAHGGGLSSVFRSLGSLSHSANGQYAGNVISRIFTGKNMDYFSQPGIKAVDILGSVWGDGMFKGIFMPIDSLTGFHNSRFPTPHLSEPLFGSPKR